MDWSAEVETRSLDTRAIPALGVHPFLRAHLGAFLCHRTRNLRGASQWAKGLRGCAYSRVDGLSAARRLRGLRRHGESDGGKKRARGDARRWLVFRPAGLAGPTPALRRHPGVFLAATPRIRGRFDANTAQRHDLAGFHRRLCGGGLVRWRNTRWPAGTDWLDQSGFRRALVAARRAHSRSAIVHRRQTDAERAARGHRWGGQNDRTDARPA